MDRRRTFAAMIRNRLEEPAPESLDAVCLAAGELEGWYGNSKTLTLSSTQRAEWRARDCSAISSRARF